MLPGIQAAFVDIGTEKSAFLHASDLVYPEDEDDDDDDADDDDDDDDESERGRRRWPRPPERAKAPPIQDVLKRGQDLIVQVSKEPISTKGPRVTAQVSLAGRFLVYMPDRRARRREPEDRRPRGAQAAARPGARRCSRRTPAASSSAPSARTSPRRRSSASSRR